MYDLDDLSADLITMPFGKYRGMSIAAVAKSDARYLKWFRTTDWSAEHPGVIDTALAATAQAKVNAAPALTLTDHQADVADQLLNALEDDNIVRLEGGAGYGKSYVTQQVSDELTRRGYQVAATAVSYVATQVLAAQLEPRGVEASTLARTLKFSKEWVDGKEVYDHSMDTPAAVRDALQSGRVQLVDECSMINDRDAVLLANAAKTYGGKLILVGDSAQLPPVKQDTLSWCCTRVKSESVATLTRPMRYSEDSALYGIEQMARNDPHRLMTRKQLPGEEVTTAASTTALIDQYVSNYSNDPAALHRMLLFRRKDVVAANNAIRTALFGVNAEVVEQDEQIMIMGTTDTPYIKDAKIGDTARYYSGQTFRVLDKRQASYQIDINGERFEIPHWEVQLDDDRAPIRILFSISENEPDAEKLGGPEFKAALQAARALGLAEDQYGNRVGNWDEWKRLQGDFVRVAYTYATSVHRAQGQTCDYAYCAPRSLLAVRGIMGRALAYVAMTRARKHLSYVT